MKTLTIITVGDLHSGHIPLKDWCVKLKATVTNIARTHPVISAIPIECHTLEREAIHKYIITPSYAVSQSPQRCIDLSQWQETIKTEIEEAIKNPAYIIVLPVPITVTRILE